jgi:hypothetical protein
MGHVKKAYPRPLAQAAPSAPTPFSLNRGLYLGARVVADAVHARHLIGIEGVGVEGGQSTSTSALR